MNHEMGFFWRGAYRYAYFCGRYDPGALFRSAQGIEKGTDRGAGRTELFRYCRDYF